MAIGTIKRYDGIYKGDVSKDEYGIEVEHGYGVYKWNDGRTYEGKWDNGKMINGLLYYPNGSVYSG